MVSQMQPQPHTVKQKHEDTPKEKSSTEPRAALFPLTAPWELWHPHFTGPKSNQLEKNNQTCENFPWQR